MTSGEHFNNSSNGSQEAPLAIINAVLGRREQCGMRTRDFRFYNFRYQNVLQR
jgi:hypothetical protein